jgi:putative membrane protein
MSAAIAASLHYLSIFLLFALLASEHLLFKAPIDLTKARSLMRIDIAYGISAGLVLLTGAARVLWFGKGWEYYLHNGLFHAKVGLFVLIGLLSIVPTMTIFGWRNAVLADKAPSLSGRQHTLAVMAIRLELLLLVCLPVLASLMARGYGMIG